MYCNLSKNSIGQKYVLDINVSDMIHKFFETVLKRKSDYEGIKKSAIRGIKENDIGYTENNYDEIGKVYYMAYRELNQLTKNYIVAREALKDISELKENWNENGASPFSRQLIEKCSKLLNQLSAEPFISPTACGAIQFEYEKENGAYLEFEIYEDRIEAFSISSVGKEDEKIFNGSNEFYQMKQMVVDFYGWKRLENNLS